MTPASVEQVGSTDSPTQDKLLALGLATAEGFRCLSLTAGGGFDYVRGALCWHSSSYVPAFNGAALLSQRLFNTRTLSAIGDYFRERSRPYCLVTIDGLVPHAAERLLNLDYVQIDSSPGMWLDGAPHRWGPPPEGLRVSPVTTPTELQAFRRILHRVFMISIPELELILGDDALEVKGLRHYLGWLDGEPVGTTSLVLSGPVAGIWNVGTLPEHRRRGLAAEMMHCSLADAQASGYSSSMLLASTEGLPLYERLGYKTLATTRMFSPARQRG